VWEATATMQVTRSGAVLATETSAQEDVATRGRAVAWVEDAEDRAALMEREAWERMLRVEEESTVVLASTREETESLVRKVTLLEGEHAEVR
jgi:hypothetical protein